MELELYQKKKVAFAYVVNRYLMKKNRRFWVHPLVSARLLKGAFTSLFTDLCNDEDKFFNYFRMSRRSFDELSSRIGDVIRCRDTNMRLAVNPVEMCAVTLR